MSLVDALDDRRIGIEPPSRWDIIAEKALDKKIGPRIILDLSVTLNPGKKIK